MADEYRNLHQAVSVRLLLPGSLNCLVPLAAMLCRTSFWHYRHYHNPLDLVPWRIFRPNSSSLTFRMQVFFAFFVIPRKSASQKNPHGAQTHRAIAIGRRFFHTLRQARSRLR